MTRRSFVIAIAVVAIANIGALVGVTRNRSGEPKATVWLDERELQLLDLLPGDGEGAALQLRLRYQDAANDQGPRAAATVDVLAANVLNEARLVALGFDCSVPAASERAASFYRGVLPRPAFVVFAVGGPQDLCGDDSEVEGGSWGEGDPYYGDRVGARRWWRLRRPPAFCRDHKSHKPSAEGIEQRVFNCMLFTPCSLREKGGGEQCQRQRRF